MSLFFTLPSGTYHRINSAFLPWDQSIIEDIELTPGSFVGTYNGFNYFCAPSTIGGKVCLVPSCLLTGLHEHMMDMHYILAPDTKVFITLSNKGWLLHYGNEEKVIEDIYHAETIDDIFDDYIGDSYLQVF
jgi:hypothetical protein